MPTVLLWPEPNSASKLMWPFTKFQAIAPDPSPISRIVEGSHSRMNPTEMFLSQHFEGALNKWRGVFLQRSKRHSCPAGFCMNTISRDKTQLPGGVDRSGALPGATLGRSRLRFIPVNHSMPAPAPANPLRHGVWDSFANKRPMIDIKLPDFLSHILKSTEKSCCLLMIVHAR